MTLQERFKTKIPEYMLSILLDLNDTYYTAQSWRDNDWAANTIAKLSIIKEVIEASGIVYREVERVDDDMAEYVIESMKKNKTGLYSERYFNSCLLEAEKTYD